MNTISENTPSAIKAHIPRLPTIPYRVHERKTDTRLAVSIPLFHSDFQWIEGGIAQERFQQVHCRGAIWTALSLLWNTDLGENGVRVYFHIEDRVWKTAVPIFDEFGVDRQWLRKTEIPNAKSAADVENVHYGKKFMALIDEQLTPDVWLIVDSDAFVCVSGSPLQWYDRLAAGLFLKYPSVLEFNIIFCDYKHWAKHCTNAVGIPHDPEIPAAEIERAAYKAIGLPYPFSREKELKTAVNVLRPFILSAYMTLPRKHKIVTFLTQHMHQCYDDEYLMAMFASTTGIFMNLRQVFQSIPQFTDAVDYVAWLQQPGYYEGYIHHLIFKSENADPFFNAFYQDLTRNMRIETPHLNAWETLHRGW